VSNLHHPDNRRRALAFEAINSCSWSAILGAPLMLALKNMGATAAVLGIAVALVPLTAALQSYGARCLPRYGYRGLMLRGWTARSFIAGLMAAVILLSPMLGTAVSTWAILGLLAVFAILRGITSCAWLPWITQLVPEAERGRYLGWSMALTQGTVSVCGVAYAAVFALLPGPSGFAVVFGWGCVTGLAAAWVLSVIPDARTEVEGDGEPVPWSEMLAHRPFRLLLRLAFLVSVAMAAFGVLWIPVLRDLYRQSDGYIAIVPVWCSLAQCIILPMLGPLVDRTGSRPALFTSLLVWLAHAVLWAGLAGGILPLSWPVMAAIQGTAGVGSATYAIACVRLLMGTIPVQGRSHFFALHTVTVALGQGVAPVLWGLALDGLVAPATGLRHPHALLYLAASAFLAAATTVSLSLKEAHALGTAEFLRELLVRTPRRALARLINLYE